MKKLSIALLIIATLFAFVSCKDEPEPPKVFYTVSFEMNGHGEAIPEQSVEEGQCAARPETDPEEEGFVFAGWYKDSECTDMFSFLSPVTETITLYAKWQEGITVTLLSNNGYGNGRAMVFEGSGKLDIEYRAASEHGVVEGYYANNSFALRVAEADGTLLPAVEGYTDESARWIRTAPTSLTTRWEFSVGFIDPFGYLEEEIPEIKVKQGEKLNAPTATYKTPAADGYEYRWSTVPPDYSMDQTAFELFDREIEQGYSLYLLYTYTGSDFTVATSAYKNYIKSYKGSAVNVTVPANIDGKKIYGIWQSAFVSASEVVSVVFSEGIEVINKGAFYIVPTLRSITIPSTVTMLEDGFLDYTRNLETINLSPENRSYTILDGVIYTRDMTKVVASTNSLTSVTIPESVTEIGAYGFHASKLKSIVIPEKVTKIGAYAFQDCNYLETVVLPENITEIPDYCFYYCYVLKDINIPEAVTRIGNRAFELCRVFTSFDVPSRVTEIGSYAFNGWRMTSFTLPEGVTTIKNNALNGCLKLTSIDIPASVTSIGKEVFRGCTSLESVTLNRNEVYPFPEGLFMDCTALTNIYVPEALVDLYKAREGWSDYASIISKIE